MVGSAAVAADATNASMAINAPYSTDHLSGWDCDVPTY